MLTMTERKDKKMMMKVDKRRRCFLFSSFLSLYLDYPILETRVSGDRGKKGLLFKPMLLIRKLLFCTNSSRERDEEETFLLSLSLTLLHKKICIIKSIRKLLLLPLLSSAFHQPIDLLLLPWSPWMCVFIKHSRFPASLFFFFLFLLERERKFPSCS